MGQKKKFTKFPQMDSSVKTKEIQSQGKGEVILEGGGRSAKKKSGGQFSNTIALRQTCPLVDGWGGGDIQRGMGERGFGEKGGRPRNQKSPVNLVK